MGACVALHLCFKEGECIRQTCRSHIIFLGALNDRLLLQVEAMQQRVACVWRYLSWHRVHGRALESLMCSLRRRLYGADIWPVMDWEKCRLTCRGSSDVDQTALEANEWPDLLKRIKQ